MPMTVMPAPLEHPPQPAGRAAGHQHVPPTRLAAQLCPQLGLPFVHAAARGRPRRRHRCARQRGPSATAPLCNAQPPPPPPYPPRVHYLDCTLEPSESALPCALSKSRTPRRTLCRPRKKKLTAAPADRTGGACAYKKMDALATSPTARAAAAAARLPWWRGTWFWFGCCFSFLLCRYE